MNSDMPLARGAVPVSHDRLSLRDAKRLIWETTDCLCQPRRGQAADGLKRYLGDGFEWHGSHPINRLQGVQGLLDGLWAPLHNAFPDLSRRTDIFIGEASGGAFWIFATGHFLGTFTAPLLGIPATGHFAHLRFGEAWQVHDGQVVGCHMFLDFLDLMRQAAVLPLPPGLGVAIMAPAPQTQDGLRFEEADADTSAATRRLTEALLEDLGLFDGESLDSMHMERFWTDDFMWYGPAGIGTTRGLTGFQRYHQQPFLTAFPDRKGGNHIVRIADGPYSASTGWPSITATHTGSGWLGLPATGKRVTMRVMDFWRRSGERFAENWVFIDLPDVLIELGVDIFAQLERTSPAFDSLGQRL